MRFLPLILVLCLGCDAVSLFSEKKEGLKTTARTKDASNAVSNSKLNAMYPPSGSVDAIASGNAVITVNLTPPKGRIELNQDEDKSAVETEDTSFSVDAFLSSIPTWLYVVKLFLFIILIVVLWIVSKTTKVGAAMDNVLAGGIDSLGGVKSMMERKLRELNSDTQEWKAVNDMLDGVNSMESNLKGQHRIPSQRRR